MHAIDIMFIWKNNKVNDFCKLCVIRIVTIKPEMAGSMKPDEDKEDTKVLWLS